LRYNVFQAIKKDPSFVKNIKKIVVLGGAFFSAGNATPSAEANVMPNTESLLC
jgi:uridine nucleosidase